MEYIEGPHLSAWIATTNPSPEEIIDAFLAAGEGLAAAHEAGVIHRDIKPANIVIDHKTARVVDFGLARVVPPGSDPTAPRHTQYGVTKGTLEYMAPEARRGRADARSDIFSFAVSLWECLASVPPFDPNAGEWRLGHQADFEGAESILPPALAQVLRRALSYRPADRHATMREFLDAIEVAARPRRLWKRPALAAGAALLIIVSAMAFNRSDAPSTAPTSIETRTPAPAPSPTPTETSPSPPSPAPAELTIGTPATTPPPPCGTAPLAGQWRLTSRVLWADDSYWIGVEGFYTLQLDLGARCEITATLTRTGDTGNRRYQNPLVATTNLAAHRDPDGHIWLTGEFNLFADPRKRHVFNMTTRGSELSGDWAYHESADYPAMTGIFRAARGSVGSVPTDLSASPCRSRCRLLCAGPTALTRCLDTCSAGGILGADGCGSADADATVPPGALALLDALQAGTAEIEPPNDKCREHARLLAGAWIVRTPGGEGELDLTPSGCDLIGEVTPPNGDLPHAVTGHVNMKGQWFVRPPLDHGGAAWAFAGRDPAFGSTSENAPLVATRGRPRAADLPPPP